MKRRELLIIFLLAVLVTGGSWFYCREISIPVGGFGLIQSRVCGWPLFFNRKHWYGIILDFLFWFLVLAALYHVGYRVKWWVVKRLRSKKER